MPKGSPEHALQVQVATYLKWCLPDDIHWTASMTGQSLTMHARVKQKAAGVRRGWPDLSFLFPDGVTRFIELKTKVGSLTPEQKAFRDTCEPHGVFAVCRSVDEVEAVLRGWGVRLKAHPFSALDIDHG